MLRRCRTSQVTIPYSQLLLVKETVMRAKEAAKASMVALRGPFNQLRTEIGVLSNAESVPDELLKQGKKN